jgi:hypothetical protein
VVRIIQASISYDPTSAIAGHAAAAAPTRPWDQPWATFTASEAAMPRASIQRARHGTGSRCRAACRITIEDAYTRPSIVPGSSRAVTPLSPYWRTTA